MKYLKLFNELHVQTYKKVAKELDKIGHVNRAGRLRSWAKESLERENFKKWSPLGKFKMDILKPTYNKNTKTTLYNRLMCGDFYVGLSLDEENLYSGDVSYWYNNCQNSTLSLYFYLGVMPADEITSETFNGVSGIQDYVYGGMLWDTTLSITFTEKSSRDVLTVPKVFLEANDSLVTCIDRGNAVKLKKFIIDVFQERIILQDTSDNKPNGQIQKIKDLLLDITGSDETFNLIQKNIKNISTNSFFRD